MFASTPDPDHIASDAVASVVQDEFTGCTKFGEIRPERRIVAAARLTAVRVRTEWGARRQGLVTSIPADG